MFANSVRLTPVQLSTTSLIIDSSSGPNSRPEYFRHKFSVFIIPIQHIER